MKLFVVRYDLRRFDFQILDFLLLSTVLLTSMLIVSVIKEVYIYGLRFHDHWVCKFACDILRLCNRSREVVYRCGDYLTLLGFLGSLCFAPDRARLVNEFRLR